MPGNDLEPYKRARLDQWNALLDQVVRQTADHLNGNCGEPAGACVGSKVTDVIDGMQPIEAKTLLEMAIIRLVGLRAELAQSSADLMAQAETLLGEVRTLTRHRDKFVYEPSLHCWVPNRPGEDVDDHEHDKSIDCDWGWMCNGDGCTVRTDLVPCPEHAPVEVPGLRLVECIAEPRHWLWVHRNDDYGHGCPSCYNVQLTAELKPFRHKAKLAEHRWCWLKNPVKRGLIWTRLMRPTGWGYDGYCSHEKAPRWRWSR